MTVTKCTPAGVVPGTVTGRHRRFGWGRGGSELLLGHRAAQQVHHPHRDPTTLKVFHEPAMHTFSGQLVVVVQATTTAGNMQLSVTGTSLGSATLCLQSKKATIQ